MVLTTGERNEQVYDESVDLLFCTGGRLVTLAFKGAVDAGQSIAIIDEAHALSLSMTGVHLALRGIPKITKILLTADPGLAIWPTRSGPLWSETLAHLRRFLRFGL